MTAPDRITAWGSGTRLSLLGGSPDFQHDYHHQRVIDQLRKEADEAWNAALVAAADALGHGYINTDHRGDTLFACNVVLDLRRKEAE